MIFPSPSDALVAFPSALGWMVLVGSGGVLKHVSFGYESEQDAMASVDADLFGTALLGKWNQPLVRRLQCYAEGARDDFRDVQIDPGPQTEFQRRVTRLCRRIPYGQTLSYGQLAAGAGSPNAARAVGRCMAANRVPLVVPCHRVVASDGRLGGYSAIGGIATKHRLLDLEHAGVV